MDVAYAIVGLVHVSDRQEVREVHDGIFNRLFDVLEPDEVLHRLAQDYHGVLLVASWRIYVIILEAWLAAHEIEVGNLHTKERLLTFFELDHVLALDAIVRRYEESLKRLALELLFLNAEIVLNLALLNGSKGFALSFFSSFSIFGLRFAITKLSVLSLDCEKARIVLVPESLNRDAVWRHLELKEVVHVNVVDVNLGIGDSD